MHPPFPVAHHPPLFLILAIVFAGCLSPERQVTPPPSPLAFQELVQPLAQRRGLPVKEEIRINLQAAHGAPGIVGEFSGATPIAEIERAYKSLGLLADNARLGHAFGEYRRISRLIDYDRTTGEVSLGPEAYRLGAPLEKANPRAARELPVALGIALALQDQHFNWRERVSSMAREDRHAAFLALAGGDAALTALSVNTGEDSANQPAAKLLLSAQIAAEIDKLAAALPNYLRRQLTLPYRAGSQFVYWAFKARGSVGVNGLYAEPPLTTSEILHPEKYFIEHAAPLRFFPAALLRRFKDAPIVDRSLGEDCIAGLLSGAHEEKSAEATAAGWRGDQLLAFRDGVNLSTVWFSSWKSENQAQEFLRDYRMVIEARHGVRFGFASAPKNALWIASARDRRGWLLQNHGSVVLLVSAASAGRLVELANDAWLDLEIDTETMELPLDWAKLSRQWSVASR